MEDLIKNIIYTGVGVAATASEKLQGTVEDLVSKGRMPRAEGKKVVDDFAKQSGSMRDEFEDRFKRSVKTIVDKFDFPSRKDYENLLKRVEKLEKAARAQRSAKATRTTVKKAAAKTTAKATAKAKSASKTAAKSATATAKKASKTVAKVSKTAKKATKSAK